MAIAHANTLATTSMAQNDESKVSGEIVSLLKENFFRHTYAGSMKGKPPPSCCLHQNVSGLGKVRQ